MTPRPPSVAAALRLAKSMNIDRLDAQLILGRLLGKPRAWLIAHDDFLLDERQDQMLAGEFGRRATGVPLAYLLGEKEFHGLMLQVSSDVLVPRPDTEVLVDWALELLGAEFSSCAAPRVIDLGTGSGAIALSVKSAVPRASVTATDASTPAIDVARGNAERLGLDLSLAVGSWWQAVPRQVFDLAISNPPYIASGDAHLDALRHEPLSALAAGLEGLDDLRAISATARDHLAEGGWLLLEHGHTQADAVAALLRGTGFSTIETRTDLAGRPRCTGARR